MDDQLLSNRYRLGRKLGSGGMSTVYLAVDETLHREVAVKLLHREISDQPDQLQRFAHEARSVASLSHPNVVAVIDAGDDAGRPFIVFEYVPGETLKHRIERLDRLPLDEAAAYAIEIGRGLSSAHQRRLVHRDVKPQNVLIDSEGRAKITDFGIARSLEAKGMTATGRVLGTTDYVSPEQAMGHVVDARSDVYSLGVVLYEMLTGDVPFRAETQVGVAMKHVNEALPDVQKRRPDLSSALAAVVDSATAKEPDDRYADLEEMLEDLERALEVEVVRAGGHSTGEATTVLRSVPKRRRRYASKRDVSWVAVALLVLAAGVAVAVAVLAGDDGPSRERGSGGGAPVDIVDAVAFDPEGDGQEEGIGGVLGSAIDGDATTTAWTTEHYNTAEFGNIKAGVGIVLDAGSGVQASAVRVRSAVGGWSAEVYSGSSEATELSGWGSPVASVSNASSDEEIALDGASGQYYLLWFTSLVRSTDSSDFRVEVTDIRLLD